MKRIVLAIRDIWNLQYTLHLLNFVYRKEVTKGCVQCTCRMLLVVCFNSFRRNTYNKRAHLFRQGSPQTGELYFAIQKGFTHSRSFFRLRWNAMRIASEKRGKGARKGNALMLIQGTKASHLNETNMNQPSLGYQEAADNAMRIASDGQSVP